MHKSAVRQYRPDNIDLAVKKAELREVSLLSCCFAEFFLFLSHHLFLIRQKSSFLD